MEQIRCVECGALSNEIGLGSGDDELLYQCTNGHIFCALFIPVEDVLKRPITDVMIANPLDTFLDTLRQYIMTNTAFYDGYRDVIAALLDDGKDHQRHEGTRS